MRSVFPTEFDPDVLEANDEAAALRRRAHLAGRTPEDQRHHEEIAAKERAETDRDAYLARREAARAANPGSGWGASPDPMEADRYA